MRVVARQHLDQLGVLVEQPGHRHVRRDHAGAFPTPFSAVSSYNNSPYTVTFVDDNGTTLGTGTATTTFFNWSNSCTADNFQ